MTANATVAGSGKLPDSYYEYLLRIATTGMTLVMGLIIAKVASGPGALPMGLADADLIVWTRFATSIAILLMLIGTIATIAYLHAALAIRFRPIYFLVCLLVITVPTYVAIEAVQASVRESLGTTGQTVRTFAEGSWQLAMCCLLLAFGGLVFYTGLAWRDKYGSLFPLNDEKRPALTLSFFHVCGITCAILALNISAVILRCVGAWCAAFGGLTYLIAFWATRISVSKT